jgi:hypothetical protein
VVISRVTSNLCTTWTTQTATPTRGPTGCRKAVLRLRWVCGTSGLGLYRWISWLERHPADVAASAPITGFEPHRDSRTHGRDRLHRDGRQLVARAHSEFCRRCKELDAFGVAVMEVPFLRLIGLCPRIECSRALAYTQAFASVAIWVVGITAVAIALLFHCRQAALFSRDHTAGCAVFR